MQPNPNTYIVENKLMLGHRQWLRWTNGKCRWPNAVLLICPTLVQHLLKLAQLYVGQRACVGYNQRWPSV